MTGLVVPRTPLLDCFNQSHCPPAQMNIGHFWDIDLSSKGWISAETWINQMTKDEINISLIPLSWSPPQGSRKPGGRTPSTSPSTASSSAAPSSWRLSGSCGRCVHALRLMNLNAYLVASRRSGALYMSASTSISSMLPMVTFLIKLFSQICFRPVTWK